MSNITLKSAEEPLEKALGQEGSEWLERYARFGYMSKGVVYLTTGVLATQAALTLRRAPETSQALVSISTQRFGTLLLSVILVGLVGYVLWRLAMALLDPEGKGTDAKGLLQRGGYLVSSLFYGSLAYTAFEILLHGRSTSGEGTEDWTAWLLTQPYGEWLMGAGGLLVIGVGLEEASRGWRGTFHDYCDFDALGSSLARWASAAGRYGLLARGFLYGLVGALLVQAALEYDPGAVEGLGSALLWLEEQPFGPWVLLLVAVGLFAYGLFAIAEGRCRRIGA